MRRDLTTALAGFSSRSTRSKRSSSERAAARRRAAFQSFEALEPRHLLSAAPLDSADVFTHPTLAALVAPNISVPLRVADVASRVLPPHHVVTVLPADLAAAADAARAARTTFSTRAAASGSAFGASSTATTTADVIVFDVPEDEFLTDITAFQGSVSLVKRGPGTLVLGGASSFTGGLVVEEGSVVIRHPDALGSGDLTLLSASPATTSSMAASTSTTSSQQTFPTVSARQRLSLP